MVLSGRAIEGELKGENLERMLSHLSFWFAWKDWNPDTELYAGKRLDWMPVKSCMYARPGVCDTLRHSPQTRCTEAAVFCISVAHESDCSTMR